MHAPRFLPACSDEMPFLLDLHLFLSRPLRPATVQGIREATAEAATLVPQAGSVYGTFPQVGGHPGSGWGALCRAAERRTVEYAAAAPAPRHASCGCPSVSPQAAVSTPRLPLHRTYTQAALDDALVRVRYALGSSHDLEGQLRSAENAFRLYLKTRPPAAAESVKRAKGLPKVTPAAARGGGRSARCCSPAAPGAPARKSCLQRPVSAHQAAAPSSSPTNQPTSAHRRASTPLLAVLGKQRTAPAHPAGAPCVAGGHPPRAGGGAAVGRAGRAGGAVGLC